MWQDKLLNVLLKVIGYPQAPKLLRRVPIHSKDLSKFNSNSNSLFLEGNNIQILSSSSSILDNEIKESLNQIISISGGNIVDITSSSSNSNSNDKVDGIVFDLRNTDKILSLTELYKQLNPLLSKINKSGRIVLLSGDTINHTKNVGSIAVTEAISGFTKALAQETGGKGITVNALQIPTSVNLNSKSYESGVLQFFLSKRSAFISGQVIPVFHTHFGETGRSVNKFDSTENFAKHSSSETDNTTTDNNTISPFSRFSVKNKRVVITGASRGIGEYTSRLYAAEGANILLVDHPSMESQLKSLANELGGKYLALDVTNEKSPELLYDSIQSAFGTTSADQYKLDIVVHNAGITRDKTFGRMSEEQFRAVLDVNLASIMRIDELLLCHKKGVIGSGGRLVYLSSIAGIAGGFGQTNYSCSKAGVVGYVAARAAEVSSRGIGINAIAPGFIETEMTKAIPFFIRNVGRRMNALNQGGYPADIAETALFLSSEASKSLNGVTIRVCGKHRVGA